jgi:hypothetical protein
VCLSKGDYGEQEFLPPIGNSDHDILMVDISTNAYKLRPTRRKVFLWKKSGFREHGKTYIWQVEVASK